MTPDENFKRTVRDLRETLIRELVPGVVLNAGDETYYDALAHLLAKAIGLGQQSWIAPWEASRTMRAAGSWSENVAGHIGSAAADRCFAAMRDSHLARREP